MSMANNLDLLLKVDAEGAGAFSTVAGIRVRSLALNACAVNLSDDAAKSRWAKALSDGEVRRLSLTGSGVFKDRASDATIRSLFFAGTIRNWQLILPNFGTVQGPFQIVALEFAADHAGEVTFDMALEGAGELRFEAAS